VSIFRDEAPSPLPVLDTLEAEAERFQRCLTDLSDLLMASPMQQDRLAERLLQGPLADAMTHAGQLALLRRLAGAPISAENFFRAPIDAAEILPGNH
jgi:hypothetical protein